jgi:hypothetical protein
MSRYRNVSVRIRPEAIPEYWLARQQAEEGELGVPVGELSDEEAREEARRLLSVGDSSSGDGEASADEEETAGS